MIDKRISDLRDLMRREKIDVYMIPTGDYHESEYVGDYFKCRQYMSGFTGSAGTFVVTQDKAALFVDGRYFIQAEHQIEGTSITLMKIGEPGVPLLNDFIYDNLTNGGCLGFDGRVVNTSFVLTIMSKCHDKDINISCEHDLVDEIWTDRGELHSDLIFGLEDRYSGKTIDSKLTDIREVMKGERADLHILTSLDDIAWLFNIRGNDIPCNPVVLSFAVITTNDAYLFIKSEALNEESTAFLSSSGVTIREYDDIYDYVSSIDPSASILMNNAKVNYKIYNSLPSKANVISRDNPSTLMKAIKNETEIANTKNAHIKDGVAVTRFMYWLKNNIGKIPMTEISASDYLESLRREQDGNLGLSFNTICAYKSNAAMMHYFATEETNATLNPEGLLLIDSGGQYYEGTTDITRTFALGPITDEEKLHFTTVAKSMLNLASARFLHGCRGVNLDILARGPLWDLGLDYKCGTGHGVGHLLNVHEAPNGFRWKIVPERNDSCVLEAGMITTDEPGVYVEGSHGIRTENELLCVAGETNEYGQFMHFEHITFAPIDLDAIDTKYLSTTDIERLNDYHAQVFEKISPYLNDDEKEWLKTYTRRI